MLGGAGNDFLDGGRGPDTYYTLFSGGGTDVLYDSGDPGGNGYLASFYGGVFPKDTVVFDDGVRIENLRYRLVEQSVYDGRPMLEVSWGTDSLLRVVYQEPPSEFPDQGAVGIERFQFADGTVLSRTEFMSRVARLPNNLPPQLQAPIPDQSATEDQSLTFTISATTFTDVNVGHSLTYSATLANGDGLPSWLSFDPANRTFTGTPGNSDVGALAIKVTATDTEGLSADDTFDLIVANANDAPVVANPLADQLATEDQPLAFTIAANGFADPDLGDSLAFSATLPNGDPLPSWLSLDPVARTFSGTPSNDDVGTVAIKVTAIDLSGASATDNFNIAVANVNDAPSVAQAPRNLAARERESFSWTLPALTFVDVDAGDQLNYALTLADGSALPAWLSFNPATRTLSGSPGEYDLGNFSLRVTATDLAGASASVQFALTVDPLPGQTITGSSAGNTISGTIGADVIDGGDGKDTILGGAGHDRLIGGADKDTIDGGTGHDSIFGGDGEDSLSGAEGDDVLLGDADEDTLTGGPGADYLNGGSDKDVLDGGDGTDLLQGGTEADTLTGGSGNDLLDAGAHKDSLDGGVGADLLAGGEGDDDLAPGVGPDVIAFNRGDGKDAVTGGASTEDTLSLGGGIRYQDLAFKRAGKDLVLETGGGELIEFEDWYDSAPQRPVLKLQVIAEAMADFDASSADSLRNKKVASFDFQGLTNAFDQARAQNPGLSSWALANALTQFHLGSSDTEALGGDLAYRYGLAGSLAGIAIDRAQEVIGSSQFGAAPQTLQPLATLQDGVVRLG